MLLPSHSQCLMLHSESECLERLGLPVGGLVRFLFSGGLVWFSMRIAITRKIGHVSDTRLRRTPCPSAFFRGGPGARVDGEIPAPGRWEMVGCSVRNETVQAQMPGGCAGSRVRPWLDRRHQQPFGLPRHIAPGQNDASPAGGSGRAAVNPLKGAGILEGGHGRAADVPPSQ
jgi:hypothetical protein